jgi:hypothetical protein
VPAGEIRHPFGKVVVLPLTVLSAVTPLDSDAIHNPKAIAIATLPNFMNLLIGLHSWSLKY